MKLLRLFLLLAFIWTPANLRASFYIAGTGGISTSLPLTILGNVMLLTSNNDFIKFTPPPISFGVATGVDFLIFRLETEYSYLIGRNADLHVRMMNLYLRHRGRGGNYFGIGYGGGSVDRLKNRYENYNLRFSDAGQIIIGRRFVWDDSLMFLDVEWRGIFVYLDSIDNPMEEGYGIWQNEIRAKFGVQF